MFGSVFEMSLRVMLLLDAVREALSLDRIVYYDYLATYGEYFGISGANLHGDNDYGVAEIAVRRKTAGEAINSLVMDALAGVVEAEDGFRYKCTEKGSGCAQALSSEYAAMYRGNIEAAKGKWGGVPDEDLGAYILRSKEMRKKGAKGE